MHAYNVIKDCLWKNRYLFYGVLNLKPEGQDNENNR
jgi:hypothetical protein